MVQHTHQLLAGALAARLDERGLTYDEAASRCREIRPRSVISRQVIWAAATGRNERVADATATALIWALDARPSELFVMPPLAPDDSPSVS